MGVSFFLSLSEDNMRVGADMWINYIGLDAIPGFGGHEHTE